MMVLYRGEAAMEPLELLFLSGAPPMHHYVEQPIKHTESLALWPHTAKHTGERRSFAQPDSGKSNPRCEKLPEGTQVATRSFRLSHSPTLEHCNISQLLSIWLLPL